MTAAKDEILQKYKFIETCLKNLMWARTVKIPQKKNDDHEPLIGPEWEIIDVLVFLESERLESF